MATNTDQMDMSGGTKGARRDARMPRPVRIAVYGLVGGVVAGALYLFAVRGDALLADLAAIAALICG